MAHKRNVAIFEEDAKFIRIEFKNIFCKKYPEFKGMTLSDAFLVAKLISFAKGEWE